jgi:hypothetical protein
MAAAAAKSTETKKTVKQSPVPSPAPTRPSSPHGTTDNIASQQGLCYPAKKSSICRLQGVNFPIIIVYLDYNLQNKTLNIKQLIFISRLILHVIWLQNFQ